MRTASAEELGTRAVRTLNTREITTVDPRLVGVHRAADDWFTPPELAARCFDIFRRCAEGAGIGLEGGVWIEPSAGAGAFLRLLPRPRMGIDVHPQAEEVRRADFLRWWPPGAGPFFVIGNPPFGSHGAYASAFIRRALLFAELVGFILPPGFHRRPYADVPNGSMIYSEDLGSSEFHPPDGKSGCAASVLFQAWRRGRHPEAYARRWESDRVEIAYIKKPYGPAAPDCFYLLPTSFEKGGGADPALPPGAVPLSHVRELLEVRALGTPEERRETLAALRSVDWEAAAFWTMAGRIRQVSYQTIFRELGKRGLGREVVEFAHPELPLD